MYYKELPDITDKQKEIVEYVYKFRFINRFQIQTLMHHKDPKRINVWLKDLVEKKYLGRIYSHKLLENTKPAIYYLNNNGILLVRYIKGEEYHAESEEIPFSLLKKFYEDKHASQSFINHCVNVCSLFIQWKLVRRNVSDDIGYSYVTKTENWMQEQLQRRNSNDFSEIKECIPDIQFTKYEWSNDFSSINHFLILFDSHVPRFAIRYKIDQYFKLKDSDEWQGIAETFPIILIILSEEKVLRSIRKYINKKFASAMIDTEGLLFHLTTFEKAFNQGILNGIWQEIKDTNDITS